MENFAFKSYACANSGYQALFLPLPPRKWPAAGYKTSDQCVVILSLILLCILWCVLSGKMLVHQILLQYAILNY